MKLYEINEEVARLQERVEYDPDFDGYVDLDTGEIMTDEELDKLFEDLQMDKYETLCWMAKCRLNDLAEAVAIREEEKRLAARRKRFEKRAERFLEIIDRECYGQPTDFGVASLKYTMSHPLDFPEEKEAEIIKWLEEHGHEDAVKVEKEIKKSVVTKLIKAGVTVPDCKILDKKNANLK